MQTHEPFHSFANVPEALCKCEATVFASAAIGTSGRLSTLRVVCDLIGDGFNIAVVLLGSTTCIKSSIGDDVPLVSQVTS